VVVKLLMALLVLVAVQVVAARKIMLAVRELRIKVPMVALVRLVVK
jgi:hypothetical protein